MLKTTWNANPPGWTHSHLGEIWIYNEGIRSPLNNSEPGGGYHFVGCAAVANQLAAAWMWLTGAYRWVQFISNLLLYFMLFCDTHDLVWEIISVSEKRMKNCIMKIINNVFEKNDEGGLFPLTRAPLGGGYFEPLSRFLAISSKPMQVSPPNLQYPLSQHFTHCVNILKPRVL